MSWAGASAEVAATPAVCTLLEADSGEGPDLPEDAAVEGARAGELANLDWWDALSYEDLGQWVPTLGRVPRGVAHEVALLRGAVCTQLRSGQVSGDLVSQRRAEKLLTFLDRLLLHSPRSVRGGKRKGKLDKVVSGRIRLAWAGDWGALWRDAVAAGSSIAGRGVGRRR